MTSPFGLEMLAFMMQLHFDVCKLRENHGYVKEVVARPVRSCIYVALRTDAVGLQASRAALAARVCGGFLTLSRMPVKCAK